MFGRKSWNARTENSTPQERMREAKCLLQKLRIVFAVLAVVVIIGAVLMMKRVLTPMNYYNHGVDLMYEGSYFEAMEYFYKAEGYKDSEEQIRELLRMENISKSFAGVNALKNAQLTVHVGEVIGLLGENGAGKSTLMNILLGIHQADSGSISFKGRTVHYKAPADALSDGISMIHQEVSLVPTLTVAENVWLGREKLFKRYGLIDEKKRAKRTEDLLNEIGMKINVNETVSNLSIAHMQMVEIVRAISYDSDLIIMDEPTSALTDQEAELLFRVVRKLTADGKAIIFITHKMDEVFQICDTLVVMRDGEYIGTKATTDTTQHDLISMIAGRDMDQMFPKEDAEITDVILEIEHLSRDGVFNDISFQLRKGEILGFCGLVGAGRTEVMRAIFGLDKYDSGLIKLEGKPVRFKNVKDAINQGLAMVTEDRLREGALHKLSIKLNMSLAYFDTLNNRIGVYDGKRERKECQQEVEALSIVCSSIDQLIANLSGGNQQKVVIGRWLLTQPKILILDEPTRGIDVGSKAEIHRLICKLAQQGVAIIMISSEMPEVLGMSDRIIVLHEGDMTYECMRAEADQEVIMSHAFGL